MEKNIVTDGPSQPAAPNIERLRKAAFALAFKLNLIHNDSRYQSVWTTAQNHGVPYNGPKYDKELAHLEQVLREETDPSLQPTSFTQPTEGGWNPASKLPEREGVYVCYTNYRDVFVLNFQAGEWQKPHRFNAGEVVAFWKELPQ